MSEDKPVVTYAASNASSTPPPYAQMPPGPVVPPRKSRSGCLIAVVVFFVLLVVGGIFLVGAMIMGLGAAAAAGGSEFSAGTREGQFRFREITVRQGGPAKIIVIPIEGIISSGGFAAMNDPVEGYKAQLDKITKDGNAVAVILTINSPGGGITATDIMHKATLDFKRRTGRPVVACLMDVAASGGYYLACASDKIVCHSSTLTGSIGVLMPLYDVTGLMSKVGVKARFVTSGKFKNMGSPFVEKTPEVLKAEHQMLQTMVNEMYEQFVTVVAEGRKLPRPKVRELADGRVYSGVEALELKLVDQIGYFDDAVDSAEKLASASRAKVVVYRRVISFVDLFTGQASAERSRVLSIDSLLRRSYGSPLYLWLMPGVPMSDTQ